MPNSKQSRNLSDTAENILHNCYLKKLHFLKHQHHKFCFFFINKSSTVADKFESFLPLSFPVFTAFLDKRVVVDVDLVVDVVTVVVADDLSPLLSTSLRPNSQPRLLRKHSRNRSVEDRGRSRWAAERNVVVDVVVDVVALVAPVVVTDVVVVEDSSTLLLPLRT